MNTLDMRNSLVSVLLKKPIITMEDINGIKVEEGMEKYRESLARTALKELEDAKLVNGLSADGDNKNTAWILNTPIGSSGQTVQISLPIASEIAMHVNSFKKSNGYEQDCDILSLTEDDLFFLCAIINTILKNATEKQEKEDEE